ncbi:FliM/FliN family flagellar motor switch protein [Erwinia tasmaniensis]|uniref:FliM/FliN family flagellar motor switch protein n=1 Tax=Erwinia tasmaniensis TaxID=338565 RepID=UPI003A4DC204
MIKHHFRHYSTTELLWRQQVLSWVKKGFEVQQNIPPGEGLFQFISDTGWEGLIDLQSWFASVMPQSAKMASRCWSVNQLEALFVNSERPLEGLPAELEYQRMESKGDIDSTQRVNSMYSLLTPQGRVWISKMPGVTPIINEHERISLDQVPVDIQFEIGHSAISVALLSQLQQGDLLLINVRKNLIINNQAVIGSFDYVEEGFMFQEDDEEMLSGAYEENASEDESVRSESEKLLPCDKISIRLGFVLQQKRLSISQLGSLYEGEVLPCQIEAEKNVTITANGTAIARGELVWIEDRMGVEVKELYQEASDGSK